MAEVAWADSAIADVVAIRAYIAQLNPEAAAMLARRLIEAGESLAHFPERGRWIGLRRRTLHLLLLGGCLRIGDHAGGENRMIYAI